MTLTRPPLPTRLQLDLLGGPPVPVLPRGRRCRQPTTAPQEPQGAPAASPLPDLALRRRGGGADRLLAWVDRWPSHRGGWRGPTCALCALEDPDDWRVVPADRVRLAPAGEQSPGRPPHRSIRCRNASAIRRRCNEPSIGEKKLIYQLMPLLVAESQRVSQLMTGCAPMLTSAALDPALVEQLEQTRALAAATGLPELRSAVVALETKVAAAGAVVRQAVEVEQGRKASAQRLAHMLPTLGPDLYMLPSVRRSVMQAIERIEIRGGKVVGVTLASG